MLTSSLSGFGYLDSAMNALAEPTRRPLVEDLKRVAADLDLVRANVARPIPPEQLASCTAPAMIASSDRDRYRAEIQLGRQAYARDEVAVLILAGGRGSRLGFESPKGCYPIGPFSERSLFEIYAEKVRAVARTFDAAHPIVVVATSEATHSDTAAFFQDHSFFSLDRDRVFFVKQAMVPSLDAEAFRNDGSLRVVLGSDGQIIRNPNGHGGCLMAVMGDPDVKSAFRANNTRYLVSLQVDNPLALVFDPMAVGICAPVGIDMVTKVVEKTDPEEKVGLVVDHCGKHLVVEYSEMPRERMQIVDAASQKLVFRAGNTAMHVFKTEFLETVGVLPFHLSAPKRVQLFDPSTGGSREGAVIQPEAFIFDSLLVGKNLCLQIDRTEEFSPVKNADYGNGRIGRDTPASTKLDLGALQRRWLEAAGVAVWGEGGVEFDLSVAVDEASFVEAVRTDRIIAPRIVETGTLVEIKAR